ncbi:FR47-like protein [Branchiibius hedensis]|uniref:FR47-like protein n=1 Tax=Branchiibius hedensis TaxID=672460 RepID=A0A2Y8ZT60_9MICO|nr:GNAT family N-acetyltransferase [Branchiibius hedensis]PWJ26770.1 FR47-like protein [Branchiibius hedensis]SSA35581.1 FR47-like protein [Branchiibius hedensis]
MQVDFFTDATDFLAVAGDYLAADPVRLSVLATNAERGAMLPPEPVDWPRWYAVVRDGASIVGVAMRTHPAGEHSVWLGGQPQAAVSALVAALLARGETALAANGELPAVQQFADAMASAIGAVAVQDVPTRLWELTTVKWPQQPAGSLREATTDDVDRLLPLLAGFMAQAAEQAARPLHPGETFVATAQEVREQLQVGRRYLLWEVDGQIVHLTGINVPAFGSARIGPVLTPKPFRGKGYAAWVVATAGQQILDAGLRACLYTDVTNPVSNGVYARIGFEALADSAEYSLVTTP